MPAPLAASARRNARSASSTSGWTMASRRLNLSGSASSAGGELLAIDLAGGGGAGEGRLDGRDGSALVELVHLGVGIADGDAERAQARRHRRLAHADGAGEADDQHQCPSMSATSRRAQLVGDLGAHAEPFLEARHRLVQQHAEAVDGREAARARLPPAAA